MAAAVLSGNRNFEGRVNPRREGQLPRLAAAGRGLRARRHASTSTSRPSRSARARDGEPVYLADIWPTPGGGRRRDRRRARAPRCSQASYAQRVRRRPATGTRSRSRAASSTPWDDDSHLHPGAAVLPGTRDASPRADRDDRGRARAGGARRLGHDRPHLARRRHRARLARRALTCGERGVAEDGLQLLRRAPRQRPGDDARHLRQHPPQER